jgi:hypothetical protein
MSYALLLTTCYDPKLRANKWDKLTKACMMFYLFVSMYLFVRFLVSYAFITVVSFHITLSSVGYVRPFCFSSSLY